MAGHHINIRFTLSNGVGAIWTLIQHLRPLGHTTWNWLLHVSVVKAGPERCPHSQRSSRESKELPQTGPATIFAYSGWDNCMVPTKATCGKSCFVKPEPGTSRQSLDPYRLRVFPISREWFRSIDLWVMGPARFRCATLLTISVFVASFKQRNSGNPNYLYFAWAGLALLYSIR